MKNILLGCFCIVFFSQCAVIRQDEVGVKRRFGRLIPKVLPAGLYSCNPISTRILRMPTRTLTMQIALESLPTKEGLSIGSEMAILYHIQPEKAIEVFQNVGKIRNGEQIIMSVLRSASADVTSKFYAKDMHTSLRETIEKEIGEKMMTILGDRGFVIENVLLKSIQLPAGLSRSIEEKLQAEQDAQRMDFTLSQERKEADRKRIEAEGIRDAQKIISEGLSPIIIQYKSLETLRQISTSNNAKLIITDGKTPYLIDSKE